jgi:enoyl-[acyl-carrier protein] reductase I
MVSPVPATALTGRRGLVVGLADERSIAWGCARALHAAGAQLIGTCLNAKAAAVVRPLAEALPLEALIECNLEREGELERVFRVVAERWGRLDFAVHSVAFAPGADLTGRVVDASRAGFLRAMDVSCHSFLRVARLAEPLMADGGALVTMSYHGAHRVVQRYGLMGPVKAALEASVRYLAAELGCRGIRVHAVSPGPIATRAASGIDRFDELLERAAAEAPSRQRVTAADVGALCAFLVSDAARGLTGQVSYVDGGQHIMA